MNSKRRLVVAISLVIVILIAGALVATQYAQASSNTQPERLVGSWKVDIVLTGPGVHFPGLLTLGSDGTVTADQPCVNTTTGHGNWAMGKHGEVNVTFVGLYEDPSCANAGTFTVVVKLHRDAGKDTWSGPFKITDYNIDNNQVGDANYGTFTLTRIAVEELP
jgi:hypothetical protein